MERTYPHGVTCWVDTEQPDLDRAREFYGALFGWEFRDAMPPGSPSAYLIASLRGEGVAAIAPAGDGSAVWNTYVSVEDADAAAASVAALGGSVLAGPFDAGPGGRMVLCTDPGGAPFRLWQPRARQGAQLTNEPGSWNFSHLRPRDDAAAREFYSRLLGWQIEDVPGLGASIRVSGYGRHLADTVDPGIYERQAAAPDGFEDVIGAIQPLPEGQEPHWHVVFSVADRDAAADTVHRLGGTVYGADETDWTRTAEVRDPHGARFTLSQYTPPG